MVSSPLATPLTSPQRARFGSPGSPASAASISAVTSLPPISTSPKAIGGANGSSAGRGRDGRPRDRPNYLSHLVTSPASTVGSPTSATQPSLTSASTSVPSLPLASTSTSTSTLASASTTRAANTPNPPHPHSHAHAPAPGPTNVLGQRQAPGAAPRRGAPVGLLVPTDRSIDDFEEQWLPRLGRLRVDREVEMRGYALYGIRSWYLSRTHWSFTIAAYTGKPTDTISCYVLVPAAELSAMGGAEEMRAATQLLAGETRAQPRKTEEGTLLVSAPAAHGQEIWPIPQGDLREAWPFIVLNTALRRLGCGGRAAMGNDAPVAAVRRKFYESYRIPMPGGAQQAAGSTATPRAGSPPMSPVRGTHSHTHSLASGLGHVRARSSNLAGTPSRTGSPASRPSSEEAHVVSGAALERDPLMLATVELVKLIQGALALWGFYGTQHEEIELDGLFCDETKVGLSKWRAAMGMESEDRLKLEKETSGGCIDPRTLSVLLSSVTSVRYQLGVLNVEKMPKDPFRSVGRFLTAWRHYHTSLGVGAKATPFLSVQGIRQLNSIYVAERRGHSSDALKVHRLLLSGVGSVASGVSAAVKGGGNDDATPARKREQHIRFKGRDEEGGLGMIEAAVGSAAAPDVITSDLEAYVKGMVKSREKDWDVMGARRVADLWSGRHEGDDSSRNQSRLRVFRRNHQPVAGGDDDESLHHGTTAIGSIRGAAGAAAGAATGAIKGITKGGLRVVGRRQNAYDTSDSEGGKNISAAQAYRRAIPTVLEPENMDDHADFYAPSHSRSPSPAISPSLHHQSMRLAIGGNSDSEGGWERYGPNVLPPRRRSVATTVLSNASALPNANTSPSSWAPRRVMMLRTASDGADVVADHGGLEWAVANGHGTGKRLDADHGVEHECAVTPVSPLAAPTGVAALRGATLHRSHSLQDRQHYRGMHVCDPAHLAIDVGMCDVVWKLRKREKILSKRAADMAVLERSAFVATQTIFDTARARREKIEALENEVAALRADLGHAAEGAVNDDRALRWASDKILFCLSEDTNTSELSWQLRELEKHWEALGDELEKRNERNRGGDGEGRRWWWPW